ncbi:MAG: CDP-alcohol phosphatidyltransferase family protein [Deltaproteobacteria bacterium]|nr:CDP-alcohol phosphatidyltransferase family protein [Deltaproteobacteria bacterium]
MAMAFIETTMSLADWLTLLRLILVPFILICFLQGNYRCAFVLFVIAGVTDLIDGSVARWLKRQTKVGAILDPVADKALMVTTVACLLILKVVPLWFFLLLALRDVSILAGLAYFQIRKIEIELKPLWSSKLATLVNLVTVILGFTLILGYPLHFWFRISLTISTLLIVLSFIQYGLMGLKIIRKKISHGTTAL